MDSNPKPELRRIFLAWSLDGDSRAGLVAWQEALAPRLDPRVWRMVPGDNLHLTAVFVGAVCESALGNLIDGLEGLRPRIDAPSAWRTGGQVSAQAAWFPGGRVARVVYAALQGEPWLEEQRARLALLLDQAGIGYDRKAFVPHVTLAKARETQAAPRDVPAYAGAPELRLSFMPVLFESLQLAQGLVYRPLWEPGPRTS